MPQFRLDPYQIADVIAFLKTLVGSAHWRSLCSPLTDTRQKVLVYRSRSGWAVLGLILLKERNGRLCSAAVCAMQPDVRTRASCAGPKSQLIQSVR
jgi:hypothetical protein